MGSISTFAMWQKLLLHNHESFFRNLDLLGRDGNFVNHRFHTGGGYEHFWLNTIAIFRRRAHSDDDQRRQSETCHHVYV